MFHYITDSLVVRPTKSHQHSAISIYKVANVMSIEVLVGPCVFVSECYMKII